MDKNYSLKHACNFCTSLNQYLRQQTQDVLLALTLCNFNFHPLEVSRYLDPQFQVAENKLLLYLFNLRSNLLKILAKGVLCWLALGQ